MQIGSRPGQMLQGFSRPFQLKNPGRVPSKAERLGMSLLVNGPQGKILLLPRK